MSVKNESHLTVGQLSRLLGSPQWKVRRVVDSLGAEIPRAGQYRLVPRDLIPSIVGALALSDGRKAAR